MISLNLSFEIIFVQWRDSEYSFPHSPEKAACSSQFKRVYGWLEDHLSYNLS